MSNVVWRLGKSLNTLNLLSSQVQTFTTQQNSTHLQPYFSEVVVNIFFENVAITYE